MVVDFVQIVLEGVGHTVLVVQTPEAALELAREHQEIDLLLSDVVMPLMSGPELYKRILELRAGLKVLFMSGYPDAAETIREAVNVPVNLIVKPFTSKALINRVSAILNDHSE